MSTGEYLWESAACFAAPRSFIWKVHTMFGKYPQRIWRYNQVVGLFPQRVSKGPSTFSGGSRNVLHEST